MTKYETPRAPDGARLCAWCGGEVRQAGVGRAKEYCKQGCREMAYRARKQQRLIDEAVRAAVAPLVSSTDARPVSSTDDRGWSPQPSVDETGPAPARPAIPVPAAVPDPPAAEPIVTPAPAPLPPLKANRRRSGMTASAIPLPPPVNGVHPGLDPRGWLRIFDVDQDQERVADGE